MNMDVRLVNNILLTRDNHILWLAAMRSQVQG